MAYCRKCGTKISDGSAFCSACGTPLETAADDNGTGNMTVAIVNNSAGQIPKSPVEPPADALVQKSGAPIPSRLGWTTWGYIISGLLVFASGLGVLTGFIVFGISCFMMDFHMDKMRRLKFKFNSAVTPDDIYNRLYPVITQKIPKAKFDRDGDVLSISFDSMIYDILLYDDATFSIWWRKSIVGSLFSFNVHKKYKKIRTDTGLLAYEIQRVFEIN